MQHDSITVYLVHFTNPIGNPANPHGSAQHYIGSARDLAARLESHRTGNGSKLMAAVAQAGISWSCVKVWVNVPRSFERELKSKKHAQRFCPVCRGEVQLPATRVVGKRVPMTQRPIQR